MSWLNEGFNGQTSGFGGVFAQVSFFECLFLAVCSARRCPRCRQVQAHVTAICAQERSQALEVKAAQDARASEIAGAVAVIHGI